MRKRVVVIGAGGASGLAVCKELLKANHEVVAALEAGPCIGGVWCARDENQFSSRMHDSLRTNLPRHVMEFPSFPWPRPSLTGDGRAFPHHREVAAYLRAYGRTIKDRIRFNEAAERVWYSNCVNNNLASATDCSGSTTKAHVVVPSVDVTNLLTPFQSHNLDAVATKPNLRKCGKSSEMPIATGTIPIGSMTYPQSQSVKKWSVLTTKGAVVEADAVVICNGHYHTPSGPSENGCTRPWSASTTAEFLRRIGLPISTHVLHSSEYCNACEFKADDVVAVLGTGASGEDVARDLSTTVAKVFLIGRVHGHTDGSTPFGKNGYADKSIVFKKSIQMSWYFQVSPHLIVLCDVILCWLYDEPNWTQALRADCR